MLQKYGRVLYVFAMERTLMLRWRRPQNKSAQELNEYNEPTEPLFPTVGATVSGGDIAPTEEVLPAPQARQQPLPQQQAQDVSQQYWPAPPPAAAVYPVLPPAAVIYPGYQPAGSAGKIQPEKAQKPAQAVGSRRSPIPLFVGMFFVAMQFLLLISFVARLFNLASMWLEVIYAISMLLLLPFRLLFEHITLPFSMTIDVEIYTLLAILVYALVSRLLVHLLKLLLHSR
jgi:hypothetical protein